MSHKSPVLSKSLVAYRTFVRLLSGVAAFMDLSMDVRGGRATPRTVWLTFWLPSWVNRFPQPNEHT